MSAAPDLDLPQFLRLASKVGHGKALGYTFCDEGEDWVEMCLEPKPELVGVPDGQILASGAIVGLLDACGGAAVWKMLGKLLPIATIDLRLDYLRPATLDDGTITARCECFKLTRHVGFVRGIARIADGSALAHATATYIVEP